VVVGHHAAPAQFVSENPFGRTSMVPSVRKENGCISNTGATGYGTALCGTGTERQLTKRSGSGVNAMRRAYASQFGFTPYGAKKGKLRKTPGGNIQDGFINFTCFKGCCSIP